MKKEKYFNLDFNKTKDDVLEISIEYNYVFNVYDSKLFIIQNIPNIEAKEKLQVFIEISKFIIQELTEDSTKQKFLLKKIENFKGIDPTHTNILKEILLNIPYYKIEEKQEYVLDFKDYCPFILE